MGREYERLCSADADRPPELLRHLHNNIFPVVAAYRALMAEGVAQAEASELAQAAFLELMEEPAEAIRKLCRFPGFYHMIPWLFGKLMPKLFTKGAGFEFVYHKTDRGQIRFDMLRCPYYQVCKELDCQELAPVFCATDDICYGNMHPNLRWNRTQTLARGGELCNFDIEVKRAPKET